MIGKNCSYFCCDDLSLIENYDKAINDETQIWDCHHKLEIELNLSRDELKEKDLYYNRPASELIFLTHEEHQRIHKTYQNPMTGKTGEQNPFYGKSHTKETKRILSIKAKEQWSDPNFVKLIKEQRKTQHYEHTDKAKQLISENSKNRQWMNNGIVRVFVKPEDFEYYKSKGFYFGFKL